MKSRRKINSGHGGITRIHLKRLLLNRPVGSFICFFLVIASPDAFLGGFINSRFWPAARCVLLAPLNKRNSQHRYFRPNNPLLPIDLNSSQLLGTPGCGYHRESRRSKGITKVSKSNHIASVQAVAEIFPGHRPGSGLKA